MFKVSRGVFDMRTARTLTRLRICADWFKPVLGPRVFLFSL